MTRSEQIRKALEVLSPPSDRRNECRRDIEHALNRVNGSAAIAFKIFSTKQGKAGLDRYARALRQVRAAYQNLNPAIRRWFSLAEIAYIAGTPTHIDREISKAEALLTRPSSSSRASQHKAAVAAAYDLLAWWGRKASTTRGGKWARLAGILAGDQAVDLFDLLRAHRRSNGPTVEKLRGERWVLYRRVPRDADQRKINP